MAAEVKGFWWYEIKSPYHSAHDLQCNYYLFLELRLIGKIAADTQGEQVLLPPSLPSDGNRDFSDTHRSILKGSKYLWHYVRLNQKTP